MASMYPLVQGRTRPLVFTIARQGSGVAVDLADATVRISLVRLPDNFHGRDESLPFRSTGPGTLLVENELCTVDADQEANPGKVSWDPGTTLVEIPPSDYAVQFHVTFASGEKERAPELGELVLKVSPALGSAV